MLRVLLFLAGCALIVAGIWWVLPWVALVVGGVLLCGVAALLERSALRREALTDQTDRPGGDR